MERRVAVRASGHSASLRHVLAHDEEADRGGQQIIERPSQQVMVEPRDAGARLARR